jgi:Protein of unknown function (DUF3987)
MSAADKIVSGSRTEQATISQPIPLIRPVAPAVPYPIDALGPVLAPAAKALMQYVQVPDALAAHAVLGFAALAAQAHSNVQTLGGPRPISLYMLTIAESGERKSAADQLAGAAIHAALREYEIAHEGHRARVKKARKDSKTPDDLEAAFGEIEEDEPPRKPWFLVSEPTAEGLFISLSDGQYSQALATDEAGQFLGGHAMTDESELRTISLLSRLWDGSPIDRVRAKDKEHTTLFGRRLAVHLLAQPEVANRLLGKSLYKAQGLLARFLICAPTSRIGTRIHDGRADDPHEDQRLRRYWHALRQLLESPAIENHEVGGLDPPCLALSPEARTLLVNTYNKIEQQQIDGGTFENVREFASKAAEHACRVAGVLTLIDRADAINVNVETMTAALQIVQAYIQEHIRLAGMANISAEITNAQKLLEWLKRTQRSEVSAKNVMQLGPYAIRTAVAAKAALALLVEYGWLVREDDGSSYVVPANVRKEWK